MLKPRALTSGDRLAMVAPSSPFDRGQFDAGVAELQRLGFEPVYDDSVFARGPNGYVAGTPELRAGAIHRAWEDPSIAGLVAVRGGYGSAQLLPLLDGAAARTARKPFVGYSDATALLTFLTTGCGLAAFHGPMLDGRLALGERGYHRPSFERSLCAAEPLGALAPDGLEMLRPGEARGPLFGGTMSLLVSSLGTPFAFDPPPGYVLLIEEVGERPYRLDRMTTQLAQAGLLARASAVVIGEMKACVEPSGGGPSARDVMATLLQDFPGPVMFNFPTGHTTGPVWTLPLGVECRVVGGPAPRLVIEEAAVA